VGTPPPAGHAGSGQDLGAHQGSAGPGWRPSRREVLKVAGAGTLAIAASPTLWRLPAIAGAPLPEQLHVQFGDDAAREINVSWYTASAVSRPRVRVGTPSGGLGRSVDAETRAYTDGSGSSATQVTTHHARLTGLAPGSAYIYEVTHDGAPPISGRFTTAPAGRAPFRFTSFGDQGTGDNTDRDSTEFGAFVVGQVERLNPLFHLLNGDLTYANLTPNRVATWNKFFNNNMSSTRNRPWMPALGNHEVESGNGPQGFNAYLNRYALPGNGSTDFAGRWYAFSAGSVKVISIDNNDVCYQNGGDIYIRKYSHGQQRRWLEQTLAAARQDSTIDWIVVFMHQLAMSSNLVNGSDLGVREEFLPLFDRYGVDLVLCGHDHDYERTYPVRGAEPAANSDRPRVVDTNLHVIDSEKGTVHLCLGGGGAIPLGPAAGPGLSGSPAPPIGTVITGMNNQDRVAEVATWSAVRDAAYSFGFIGVDVDPGTSPGGLTRLSVTYYRTAPSAMGSPTPFDNFVLQRHRSDARLPGAAVGSTSSALPNTGSGGAPEVPIRAAGATVALGAAAAIADGRKGNRTGNDRATDVPFRR
jgi:3',5'-cyclic AMP phosphodiesterase CpdA